MKEWFILLVLSLAFVGLALGQGETVVNAAAFHKADCGANINAAEASLAPIAAEIQVDNSCGTSAWSAVTISNDHHTLYFLSPGPYAVRTITLSGNVDSIIGPAYLAEVNGSQIQNILVSTGNDNRILNLAVDGSAPMGSTTGTLVDAVQIRGSRNLVHGNHIVATQGFGISVLGTATGGSRSGPGGDHNKITQNWVYNCNANPNNACIAIGNVSPSAGSFANWNEVSENYVDCGGANSGDGIFETASIASAVLSGGTMARWNSIIGNQIRNCRDSPIEIGEGSYHTLAEANIISDDINAGIVVRDAVGSLITHNTINLAATARECIGVALQNQPPSFDERATILGNHCTGYVPSGGYCYFANQAGVHFKDNDCEFTAGSALIQSVSATVGTAALITNKPLDLPNGKSIIITGTTHYDGTFAILSANDLTNTYTFSHAAAPAEKSGTVSFVTSAGGNLQGTGIGLPTFGPAEALGNRIRRVATGIDLNPSASTLSLSDLSVRGNTIDQVRIGVNLFKVTLSHSELTDNFISHVVTVGVDDTAASGSNSSYYSTMFDPEGWGGVENNSGLPGFIKAPLSMRPRGRRLERTLPP